MCGTGQAASTAQALAVLEGALEYLSGLDVASLPTAEQAEVLRGLARAESKHTAAQARVLSVFAAQGGHEDDGHGSARAWLKWQTQITSGAAAGAVGWARRLAAHPVIARALAAGQISPSWARQICEWSDRLPAPHREDADQILAAAAAGGATLADIAGLAEELYRRCAPPDPGDDGFDGRYFRLGITFGGAGRAEGDLTPGCAAALAAVLDALAKKAGPEDTRTAGQRRHDALGEACKRLIAARMVPGRAGQPTHVQVQMSLAQLRGLPGGSAAEAAWAAGQPGWLSGPEADAAACDATVVPVVTGHIDWSALDQLTDLVLASRGHQAPPADAPACAPPAAGTLHAGAAAQAPRPAGGHGPAACPAGCTCPGGRYTASHPGDRHSGQAGEPLAPATRDRLARALLGLAAAALSGPGGLAAHLRHTLLTAAPPASSPPGSSPPFRPLTSVSLPLDIGAATETIPAHLRRAATTRHRSCAFPGCGQPASVCDIHHLIPRARGGPTALHNLVPACSFHHLVAIHRWGWTLRLHPDGTTTATSPDGTRTLHSHSPPTRAA